MAPMGLERVSPEHVELLGGYISGLLIRLQELARSRGRYRPFRERLAQVMPVLTGLQAAQHSRVEAGRVVAGNSATLGA